MSDITLEKTHALLEHKADKSDVQRIDKNVEQILQGMDAQAQQLDILRTDMKAVSGTLDVHEERLGSLEEHNFGRRIRDDKKIVSKELMTFEFFYH